MLFPKCLGTPEELAQLMIAIVENGYSNGEIFRLDSGLQMPPR